MLTSTRCAAVRPVAAPETTAATATAQRQDQQEPESSFHVLPFRCPMEATTGSQNREHNPVELALSSRALAQTATAPRELAHFLSMRFAPFLLAVALLGGAWVGVAPSQTPPAEPTLRVVKRAPVVIEGHGFPAGAVVTLVARAPGLDERRTLRPSLGEFRVGDPRSEPDRSTSLRRRRRDLGADGRRRRRPLAATGAPELRRPAAASLRASRAAWPSRDGRALRPGWRGRRRARGQPRGASDLTQRRS